MKKQLLSVIIHIVAWFTFLALPYMYQPMGTSPRQDFAAMDTPPTGQASGSAAVTADGHVYSDMFAIPQLVNSLLFLLVFYAGYLLVIPHFHKKRNYGILLLWMLGSLLLFAGINLLLYPAHQSWPDNILSIPFYNLFMFVMVMLSSCTIGFYSHMRRVEKEKLSAELSFLKAQVNPHFLFNTLNSIYSLSLSNSDYTSDAIVRLSSIMRYSVTDAGHIHVKLGREIDYISNYIDLQRLRLTESVSLHFEVDGDPDNLMIAPLLLISFVENAFKYGVSPEEASDIDIRISIKNTELHFRACNKKVFVQKDPTDEKGIGVGISNTKKRLNLLYPNRHTLHIMDNAQNFVVELKLRLA